MSATIKSYFQWQKHDLSDASNQDAKKTRESSLNVSLYKHDIDIFEEGIKSPCSSCF